MRLAREFKRPDWRAMLSEMSATEYQQWLAFFDENPFYDRLIDAEFASLRYSIAVMMWGHSELTVQDFSLLNTPEKEDDETTDDELMLLGEGIYGGMRYGPAGG
ncbi:phage tail assembly protein T [Dickeya fangzhongdai]|uniref:phage tail assembly protein T n=1 Tax=Dickeya fangzhongdai TaxID=1778540 RepID=UPI001ADB66A5|nr:phage tail assembly protein T [Dickeya fangzhongdai]MBO8132456.1 phage tail assembly protein T [Dickeya fangzhongdai]